MTRGGGKKGERMLRVCEQAEAGCPGERGRGGGKLKSVWGGGEGGERKQKKICQGRAR